MLNIVEIIQVLCATLHHRIRVGHLIALATCTISSNALIVLQEDSFIDVSKLISLDAAH